MIFWKLTSPSSAALRMYSPMKRMLASTDERSVVRGLRQPSRVTIAPSFPYPSALSNSVSSPLQA